MIEPTVGRVVWYYPLDSDEQLSHFASVQDGKPLAAIVCHVWNPRCINLSVFDPNGLPRPRTSVLLIHGDGERPSRGFAEWMPYQKGQAAKTEQAEKLLGRAETARA